MGFGLAGFGSFAKNPKTQSYFEDFPPGATKVRTNNSFIFNSFQKIPNRCRECKVALIRYWVGYVIFAF